MHHLILFLNGHFDVDGQALPGGDLYTLAHEGGKVGHGDGEGIGTGRDSRNGVAAIAPGLHDDRLSVAGREGHGRAGDDRTVRVGYAAA